MARMSKMQQAMMDNLDTKEEIIEEVKPVVVEQKTEYESRPMAMDYEFKILSMKNAIKILPPNMLKDGRHLPENIQAICGFMVTPEMLDLAYEGFTHES